MPAVPEQQVWNKRQCLGLIILNEVKDGAVAQLIRNEMKDKFERMGFWVVE